MGKSRRQFETEEGKGNQTAAGKKNFKI